MAWQVLTGAIEWWRDEALHDAARAVHGQRSTGEPPAAPGSIDCVHGAFAARREPWRASLLSLDDPAGPGGHFGVTSWAADGSEWLGVATATLEGHPAVARAVGPHTMVGDLGLQRMIEPAALERFAPRPWAATWTLRQDLDRWQSPDVLLLPECTAMGVSHYEAEYDADLDVLTEWRSLFDGRVVDRISLTYLTRIA